MKMNKLTELIRNDMKPSLGVTEPGAIALAMSRARSLTSGGITSILLEVNSGIYKNAFTCGIPNTDETGNLFAAALGAVAGDWTKGLSALDNIVEADITAARKLIESGVVTVSLHEISSELYIQATITTDTDCAQVLILGAHDHIARVLLNGAVLEEDDTIAAAGTADCKSQISEYKLNDFWQYVNTVPPEEIGFIMEAHKMNLKLMEKGLAGKSSDLCKVFASESGDRGIVNAKVMTAAAIEARVRGYDSPAMSITGSGNHGILCTVPLYAHYKANGLSNEALLKATALSYLVTMYIKEYSGRLSAFCGCAIAAGTGAAVGILYLSGGTLEQAGMVIQNMASSLTGMICTGGNPACVLKASIAVDIGKDAVSLALADVCVDAKHGINGYTPEQTMRYMGEIADPGMTQTENTIVRIFQEKTSN